MVSIDFRSKEMKRFRKNLTKAGEFGRKNVKEMSRANRKVATIYIRALRSAIKPAEDDIDVYAKGGGRKRPGRIRTTVPKGAIRRSLGKWKPRGDKYGFIMAGPRSASLGKSVDESRDGWAAAIMEGGHAANNRYVGRNTGVFRRTMQATQTQMERAQLNEYRNRFKEYFR